MKEAGREFQFLEVIEVKPILIPMPLRFPFTLYSLNFAYSHELPLFQKKVKKKEKIQDKRAIELHSHPYVELKQKKK